MLTRDFERWSATYSKKVNAMVERVRKITDADLSYAAHLADPCNLFQYVDYVGLVRESVDDADSHIVDWGGQYGQVTALLQDYFARVDCYVPDLPSRVESYRPFHDALGVESVIGPDEDDFDRIAYDHESVDVVISSGVLEHVREGGTTEASALEEIYRVLRPGGKLLIWNLPARLGSVELLNRFLGRSVHQWTYRSSEIQQLLRSAGFNILRHTRHELMNQYTKRKLSRLLGESKAHAVDYALSRSFPFHVFAQHHTLVCQKPVERQAEARAAA